MIKSDVLTHAPRPLQTRNDVWKKNRNAYAKLLLEQLRCGRLEEPFHASPPTAPLPTLNKSLLYAYAKPKNNPSKPRHMLTPSQELDTYITAQLTAPPSPILMAGLSGLTPTSYQGPHAGHAMREPLTAASVHGPSSMESSWETNPREERQPRDIDRDRDLSSHQRHQTELLELRLIEAEERLKQHSTLLALALDISTLSARKTPEERSPTHGSQHRRSIEDVLQRAERGRDAAGTAGHKVAAPGASTKHSYRSSEYTAGRLNAWSSRPVMPSSRDASPPPTEEALMLLLDDFEQATAALRSKLGILGGNKTGGTSREFFRPFSAGSKGKSNGGYPCMVGSGGGGKETHGFGGADQVHKSIKIPARHTLKSAASAVAARKALVEETSPPGFKGVGEAGKCYIAPHYRVVSAPLLPQPRPGSTEALISEVSALRRRLAANLASVERSMQSAGMASLHGVALPSPTATGLSPLGASGIGVEEYSGMSPSYGNLNLGASLGLSPTEPSLLSSCIGIDNDQET